VLRSVVERATAFLYGGNPSDEEEEEREWVTPEVAGWLARAEKNGEGSESGGSAGSWSEDG